MLRIFCSLQLQAEIKRIFPEKNLSPDDTKRKWMELVPKNFKLAEVENNSYIEMILKDVENYSDGK